MQQYWPPVAADGSGQWGNPRYFLCNLLSDPLVVASGEWTVTEVSGYQAIVDANRKAKASPVRPFASVAAVAYPGGPVVVVRQDVPEPWERVEGETYLAWGWDRAVEKMRNAMGPAHSFADPTGEPFWVTAALVVLRRAIGAEAYRSARSLMKPERMAELTLNALFGALQAMGSPGLSGYVSKGVYLTVEPTHDGADALAEVSRFWNELWNASGEPAPCIRHGRNNCSDPECQRPSPDQRPDVPAQADDDDDDADDEPTDVRSGVRTAVA